MRRIRRLSLDELAPYLIPPADPALPGGDTCTRPLDWQAVFGNGYPVEIEVGFGKGLFLTQEGQAHPEVNYLGIEILRKYQLFTANRLAKRNLHNVRVALGDARTLLRDRVAAGSVQTIHVYFPDPWWKKRHLKRRVFTPEFASECERVLVPGGRLQVVTDVEDYHKVIVAIAGQHAQLRPLPPVEPKDPAHDLDYRTNFERKFRKEGRPIFSAYYERL